MSAPDLLKALELCRPHIEALSVSDDDPAIKRLLKYVDAALTSSSVDAVLVALPDPDGHMYSDAMDAAFGAYHGFMYGIRKNADKAGEKVDEELLHRRAIAVAMRAYFRDAHPVPAKNDAPLPFHHSTGLTIRHIGHASGLLRETAAIMKGVDWDCSVPLMVADYVDALEAPAPAAAVEGWQMVPKEPTPAMSAAGFAVSEAEHDPAGVYRAMLAAAPSPPASPAAGPGLLPDDYARGLSDGLRQAAEIAKYNMHLAIRDAILDLIPK